jgi:hypothetical protein
MGRPARISDAENKRLRVLSPNNDHPDKGT